MFRQWVTAVEDSFGRLDSIIEVGCGTGHGYLGNFEDRQYVGIDLSPKATRLNRQKNDNPGHSFLCCDIIESPPGAQADLVFSQATIDNVYDMDAFLRSMARMTKKLLYVSNYRGYSPELEGHRYQWDPKMGVFFNDIAPPKIESLLRAEGFKTIVVFPQKTFRDDITSETVVIASRSEVPESALMAEHQPYFEYVPYQVEPSELSLEQVLENTNLGCYSFSEPGTDLTNDLPYFEDVVSTIKGMENIRPGTMEELALGSHGVNLAIRADVDMDVAAALEMARIAGERRFPVSFYLTHTAAYYGSFVEGTFQRNERNASLYVALQRAGAEVALHTDPYAVYLQQRVDGAAAVRAELAWLREIGLNIRGTSAHNAAPLYGVENFEIFQGRTIRSEKFLLRNYRFLPLGVLNERELGLSYEAGKAVPAGAGASAEKREAYLKGFPQCDFIRDDHWFRTYILDNPYCSWGYSYNIWVIGRDSWVISGTKADGTKRFQFKVGWDAVAEFLRELGENETCMMVVHPIYMSWREQAGAWPKGSQSAFATSNRTCVLA